MPQKGTGCHRENTAQLHSYTACGGVVAIPQGEHRRWNIPLGLFSFELQNLNKKGTEISEMIQTVHCLSGSICRFAQDTCLQHIQRMPKRCLRSASEWSCQGMNLSHSSEFCDLRHLQQAYIDYNIYIYAYNILISVNIYCEYINIHLYYSIYRIYEYDPRISPECRGRTGGRNGTKWIEVKCILSAFKKMQSSDAWRGWAFLTHF